MFAWFFRFLEGSMRVVNNLFLFFWNHVHPWNFFFHYITCLFSIKVWVIPENSSILYETELYVRLVIAQIVYWIDSFFRYRDNSIHLHECSPFWEGSLITSNKENYICTMLTVLCRHAHCDWHITEAFIYVKVTSNIV